MRCKGKVGRGDKNSCRIGTERDKPPDISLALFFVALVFGLLIAMDDKEKSEGRGR